MPHGEAYTDSQGEKLTVLGLLLLVTGAGLVVAEAHVPSHGALGGAGATALLVGAILAVAGAGAGLAVAIPVAAILSASAAGLLVVVGRKAGVARQRRIGAGTEALIGRVGVLRSWSQTEGRVYVEGSLWRARRSWPDGEADSLTEGDRVVVERVTGLTLAVRKAEEWEVVS
jgi:membrane-bound ClpP family serine protease